LMYAVSGSLILIWPVIRHFPCKKSIIMSSLPHFHAFLFTHTNVCNCFPFKIIREFLILIYSLKFFF
jgi:hypothetical protein